MSETMKERPIPLYPWEVRAILEGRKTQTRRVCVPTRTMSNETRANHACPYGVSGDRLWVRETWGIGYAAGMLIDPCLNYRAGGQLPLLKIEGAAAWCHAYSHPHAVFELDLFRIKDGWRSSIQMPRWASRILLEITKVRVERVQQISAVDLEAEGVRQIGGNFAGCYIFDNRLSGTTAKECFSRGWDSSNGRKHPWSSNPWVWCIEFRRVQ